ncbi:MAG: endonuclease/exonuclease/phosphatase family protein [Micropruina sp.]|nr:endonuclease/exonuclease/phosphatase family protein [Micropruina sp.]
MSFNILTGTRTAADFPDPVVDDDVIWENRQPRVVAWLRSTQPDIVALQENEGAGGGSADRQSARLGPDLIEFGWAQTERTLPILYRRSTHQLLDEGEVLLSRRLYERVCTWARLSHRGTGRELLVFNTHLDPFQTPEAARSRSASMDVLITTLRRMNPGLATPFVLMGDFNARDDETRPIYADHLLKLATAGLTNARLRANKDVSQVPGAASHNAFGTVVEGRWGLPRHQHYQPLHRLRVGSQACSGEELASRHRPRSAVATGSRWASATLLRRRSARLRPLPGPGKPGVSDPLTRHPDRGGSSLLAARVAQPASNFFMVAISACWALMMALAKARTSGSRPSRSTS